MFATDLSAHPGRDRALAAARIALGAYWLWEQHWKLPPDFGIHNARGLLFSFEQSIRYPTIDFYRHFLQNIVVPHFYVFGWLVFLGETTIGLLLTMGILTRLAALLGTLEAINLFVAEASTPEKPWLYIGIFIANLLALLIPSNRTWSIDRRLASGSPEIITRAGLVKRAVHWATWGLTG